jgi:hypothetical protein
MKLFWASIILSTILALAACNKGNDTFNEVPVIHARIISVQDEGYELMIITDKGIRAELQEYNYKRPGLAAGEQIMLERWNSGIYVYKGSNDGQLYDFHYHESGYEHKLD